MAKEHLMQLCDRTSYKNCIVSTILPWNEAVDLHHYRGLVGFGAPLHHKLKLLSRSKSGLAPDKRALLSSKAAVLGRKRVERCDCGWEKADKHVGFGSKVSFVQSVKFIYVNAFYESNNPLEIHLRSTRLLSQPGRVV